jgi:Asp-tRNA(Asn)/Glu-tRNA(Gln) amidotransferase A subunit family amidase
MRFAVWQKIARAGSGRVSFFKSRESFLSGSDTPRAFLERALEQVRTKEPDVKAFAYLDIESARKAADDATVRYRARKPLSDVDGMPVGIKDVFDTSDMPTEMGSRVFAGRKPTDDAAHVAALKTGGAIILGKTVTSEFAVAGNGPTRNPLDYSRSPGETSAGSAAAVAAGMVSAATASQARGSIIKPASYCGVYGFKPTMGALNRWGTLTPAKSYDHLGALAGSTDDLWSVLWQIVSVAGGDPGFPGLFGQAAPPPARSLSRLAVIKTAGWPLASSQAQDAFAGFIEAIRASGISVAAPHDNKAVDDFENFADVVPAIWRQIAAYENRWPLDAFRQRAGSLLTPAITALFDHSKGIDIASYREALETRAELAKRFDALGREYDAFITLSAEGPAQTFPNAGSSAFHELATLTGVPAISIPALQMDGLPLGVQIIGCRHNDYELIGFARYVMEKVVR